MYFLGWTGRVYDKLQVLAFTKKLDICADASEDFVSPGTSKARLDRKTNLDLINVDFSPASL